MTDEEIQFDIAKICGFTDIELCFEWEHHDETLGGFSRVMRGRLHGNPLRIRVPRYGASLDAMHQAEEFMLEDDKSRDPFQVTRWRMYTDWIYQVVGSSDLLHISPRVKAQAFLLTYERCPSSTP